MWGILGKMNQGGIRVMNRLKKERLLKKPQNYFKTSQTSKIQETKQ